MDRCYEGIYQYLEFFSVLCEHEEWKILFIQWDFAYELVSLLQDLELYIPKGDFMSKTATANEEAHRRQAKASTATSVPAPLAVERPYDPVTDSEPLSPSESETEQDAWEFSWSNLKKLNILVLAALVWHCPTVQAQVRRHGGIDTILNCCGYDSHNLYIKEHAIVCLRSVLEYNLENQEFVGELKKLGKVPAAVLEDEKCREHLSGSRARPPHAARIEKIERELFW
jgi:palmitoyltransferase